MSSAFSNGFTVGWQHRVAHDELARELLRPIHPATNPPELLRPTPVRCLRPFWLAGRAVARDEIVTLQRHDAVSLAAIGNVEIL